MPSLEFVRQSAQDITNLAANTGRLVNLYPEPIDIGGTAQFALKAVPGIGDFAELPGTFVRAMEVISDRDETGTVLDTLYAASNGKLHTIAPDGSVAEIGTIADCPFTTMSGNNGDVTIVCGGKYYLWNGTTLTEPTAGAFDDFGSVAFLGGYTILTERGGRRFQWSALADPSDLPGLNFATAESRDDAIIRAFAISGNLWLFKRSSAEVWQTSGSAAENAFVRLAGGVVERGLRDFGLITKIPGGAFFVGDDGVCYRTSGASPEPIRHAPVEIAIDKGEASHVFYYEHQGHKFCVVRFRDRPAWCWDMATGLWHERATGDMGPFLASRTVDAFGNWHVAADGGIVGRLADRFRDLAEPLVREATTQTLYNSGQRYRIREVEFMGNVGRSDIGRDAKALVQFSRDGGQTWGLPQKRSMGDLGDFGRRMVFGPLGKARKLTARVRVTDPAELTLWSLANVEVRQ